MLLQIHEFTGLHSPICKYLYGYCLHISVSVYLHMFVSVYLHTYSELHIHIRANYV